MVTRANYEFLFWIQTLIRCGLFVVVFIVLLAGWKRHRNFGYVILASWAAVSGTWSIASQLLMPTFRNLSGTMKIDPVVMNVVTNTIAVCVLNLLLLFGLYWLVFKPNVPK